MLTELRSCDAIVQAPRALYDDARDIKFSPDQPDLGMLIKLRHRILIGYIAFFALMLNAVTQVDCCVSSIAGEHGAAIAVAVDTAQKHDHQAHDEHTSDHGQTRPASGHSGHDAGSCDCKDGMCGQSLIGLAKAAEARSPGHEAGEAWVVVVLLRSGQQGARHFQIRAPPALS